MSTHKKSLKKAKDGDLLDRVSKTKVKDITAKAERFIERGVKKGKKLVSDTVEKVKNTTVGDVVKTVASSTPVGMAYNLAKKAANSDVGKQIKEDLKPERLKKGLKNIGAAVGMNKNGGSVKKMKNGGSLSGLKASTKRDKGIDPKGAFTKVQKKTLRGAKGKASLTKDKQLGATKMTAKSGANMKKGKSC